MGGGSQKKKKHMQSKINGNGVLEKKTKQGKTRQEQDSEKNSSSWQGSAR